MVHLKEFPFLSVQTSDRGYFLNTLNSHRQRIPKHACYNVLRTLTKIGSPGDKCVQILTGLPISAGNSTL